MSRQDVSRLVFRYKKLLGVWEHLKDLFKKVGPSWVSCKKDNKASVQMRHFLAQITLSLVNWIGYTQAMDHNTSLFSTKAMTLEWFRSRVKASAVCPSLIYTVAEWQNKQSQIIDQIATKFPNEKLIIRSSSSMEDGSTQSLAGMFESVKNVNSKNLNDLQHSIEKVIDSYRRFNISSEDVFFIQPMVQNVAVSGVLFTHDINTGAPYYVINYDDVSGETDTVTSGMGTENRTLYVHRNGIKHLKSSRFRKLVSAVTEIEKLVGEGSALDIEFAMDHQEHVFLLQVRPITTTEQWKTGIQDLANKELQNVEASIASYFHPSAHKQILGKTSVFSNMADWNPAEMIGEAPRALATSLYKHIITDSIWAEARAEVGLKDLSGVPLLISLGGKPYIDVRNSFNSFLPVGLPKGVGQRLIDFWTTELASSPWLHDKVEFEVATTCYALDFEAQHEGRYLENGFSQEHLNEWKLHLHKFTNDLIDSDILDQQKFKIETLQKKRKSYTHSEDIESLLVQIKTLLDDCKEYGTKPFSIFARAAFVAEEFLRSLIRLEVISETDSSQFKQGVETVLSDFLFSVKGLKDQDPTANSFNQNFGHLRPGTYDILSPRYDSLGSDFFNASSSEQGSVSHKEGFTWTAETQKNIDELLKSKEFTFDFNKLIKFIKDAIIHREYAKLQFTKNLSDAIELIAKFGQQIGLNRNQLSHISLDCIVELAPELSTSEELKASLLEKINLSKKKHIVSKAIRFPTVIHRSEDIWVAPLLKAMPNFITHDMTQAELVFVSGKEKVKPDLNGKIVAIEGADPGYDWIFLSSIKGLVTKFGGTNSHMAIRCAELGIPAAIGCGGQLFDELRLHNSVLLDCESRLIRMVR